MITNGYDKPRPLPGQFAPMVPPAVIDATMDYPPALSLWVHAQSKPKGWRFDDRDAIARELGWSKYRTRKAIKHLIDAGLYVVVRERNAAGQFITFCTFATVAVATAAALFAQVRPKAGAGSTRHPARKQLLRKSLTDRAKRPQPRPDPPALWQPAPASERLALALGTSGLECEHGTLPHRCAVCRRRR